MSVSAQIRNASVSGRGVTDGAGRTGTARVNDTEGGSGTRDGGGLANVASGALSSSTTVDGAANLEASAIKAAAAGLALNVGTQRNGSLGTKKCDQRQEKESDSH